MVAPAVVADAPGTAGARGVLVLATGPLATVQDAGRPGLGTLGVGVSGAADRTSFRLANRLVGNPEEAAAVEVTFGGLWIRAQGVVTVAVTGASTPVTVRRGGDVRPAGALRPIVLADGDELRLGPPVHGLRSYLALRGGVDVDPVLGSRSTDVLAGLGPDPLSGGSLLPVGPEPADGVPSLDGAPVSAPGAGVLTLRAMPGPRHDWFTEESMHRLFRTDWEVGNETNRVGMRLSGPPMERRPVLASTELPSEGVVRGSVQVPASGLPIVFLVDHPVTGGYPVAAVLADRDVDLAAQARPGQRIRFWPTR
ncbi:MULTISPECIES: 5-oxoprolinase subunit C family protein [Pseudonocardia]|uniref:KipI antagonist n=2 Tax=Pseudonocardia TaxID=1847 RepID=A0A1Y2MI10_PSEAH|nr:MULTISPECIES: biotin-dependent carboxyltransferase family protein [Pseudonocardia]OSY34916.1 KipI antagonist [Pseudonocardia autotrophica]TDN76979.1 biotin-dependent carboxylase-like uncharacterized protein [Pseudonocardia autotrophica]BBG00983.1 allophanate hydrolase [Pseudonocardia autotrophica]GEC29124.1 allophanate hydrolase [Pseudonocardia saturnea]